MALKALRVSFAIDAEEIVRFLLANPQNMTIDTYGDTPQPTTGKINGHGRAPLQIEHQKKRVHGPRREVSNYDFLITLFDPNREPALLEEGKLSAEAIKKAFKKDKRHNKSVSPTISKLIADKKIVRRERGLYELVI